MKNAELADLFSRMADLMEILGENRFKIAAYRRGADAIRGTTEDIEKIAARGELRGIAGVGEAISGKIAQYLGTGRVERYEELKALCPETVAEVMRVPGVGPKTALKLWREAGVATVAQLRDALATDPARLTSLRGLGQKKVGQIAEALETMAAAAGRMRLGDAWALGARLVDALGRIEGVAQATLAGSARRGRETVGDIDLVCAAAASEGRRVVDAFAAMPGVTSVLGAGPTRGSVVLEGGVQADLRVVEPASFGAALLYFTGSKGHNVRLRELAIERGLKLNEYGLLAGEARLAGATEEEVYEALGLQFVPPELREDAGEVAAARARRLPALLSPADLRGDLHAHTTASDGHDGVDAMIVAAKARGFEYVAITDHSKGQVQANGLSEERLLDHVAAIRRAARRHQGIAVLAGAEVDIRKDGALDYPDEVLAQLDIVVASPHSALSSSGPEATQRLVRAAEHPRVNVIAHPTGRIVLGRRGMEIDVDELARAAARCGVALEINAEPSRLDLRDHHVKAALAAGARLAIDSDAHDAAGYDVLPFGVATARRGWATRGDVINAWPLEKLRAFLAKT
jgi:DNA polymerase (family 10)